MAKLAKYDLVKTLGAGGFAKVKLGVDSVGGESAALKIMKREAEVAPSFYELVMNEVNMLKGLDHKNIVSLIDFYEAEKEVRPDGSERDVFCLVLEFAKNGELFNFIAQGGALPEKVTRFYFHQLVDVLEYLHDQGISHRDLKPDNMLLDEHFELKLADFGFSSSKPLNETHKGTNGYKAPEIHLGEWYSGTGVDLFAAGVILFIMHTGHPPFVLPSGSDPYYKYIAQNLIHNFFSKHSKTLPTGFDTFSEEIMNLIATLFLPKASMRISLAEIKAHPWYLGEVATREEVQAEMQARLKAMEDQVSESGKTSVPSSEAATDVYTEYSGGHRGEGDAESGRALRKAKAYVAAGQHLTTFFSTSEAGELFDCLAVFASKQTKDISISEETYKMKLCFTRKNKMDPKSVDKVAFSAEVLQVPGHEKRAVEFKRKAGDVIAFNQVVQDARLFFGGHVNAKL